MSKNRSSNSCVFTVSERSFACAEESIYEYVIRSNDAREVKTLLMCAHDAWSHPADWVVIDGEINTEAVTSVATAVVNQFDRLISGGLSISSRDRDTGFSLRASYDDVWHLDVGFGTSRVLVSSGNGARWSLRPSGLSGIRDLTHCFKSFGSERPRHVGSFDGANGVLFKAGAEGEWLAAAKQSLDALNDDGARNVAFVLAHTANMNASEVVACESCGHDFPRPVGERWKKICRTCFNSARGRGASATPNKQPRAFASSHAQPGNAAPCRLTENDLVARIDSHLSPQGLILRKGTIVPFVIVNASTGSIVRPKIMDLEALGRELGLA